MPEEVVGETEEDKLAQLERLRYEASHAGSQQAVDRQHTRGKYTARERIDRLLDPRSFDEIDRFVRHRTYKFGMLEKRPWGDAVVAGHGTINGRPVCVFSQDCTVIGGSLGEAMSEKICKTMDLALKVGCPIIGMNDSGGARIQEGVAALMGYTQVFGRNVLASGVIPQLSLILGPCAGGAVYTPAVTDFVFMVEKTSHMFVTGPQVIKLVTGEDVELEELGGAITHNTRSGAAHFACEDEDACLEDTRYLLSFLPQNEAEFAPRGDLTDSPSRQDPELDRIVPDDTFKPYDMHEVIRRVVDHGEFLEVHERFAPNMLCGFARLNGHAVGIYANQPSHLGGTLDIDASLKAARFIRTCDSFNLPLLIFTDTPGILPGTSQEWGGIIRSGAALGYAYAEARVPKLTVVTRKAYGGAYAVMGSNTAIGTRLGGSMCFAWPIAELAVMGAETSASLIYRREIAAAPDPEQLRQELVDAFKVEFANPYSAAERGLVDDVIVPHETRPKLIAALETMLAARDWRGSRRHGNIPL